MKRSRGRIEGKDVLICLQFVFTVIVFGPYEIFLLNQNDFIFGFLDFWHLIAGAGGILFIGMLFAAWILPEKVRKIYILSIFALSVCCYLQVLLMNRYMESLLGQNLQWPTEILIINVAIWFCVLGCMFALYYFKKGLTQKLMVFLGFMIIMMQAIALISLLLTTDLSSKKKTEYITDEKMLELSAKENVVLFILDYFDGRIMDELLKQNPDYLDSLNGFTYFPNATSVHSRTYPSITYLLTDQMCYFDQTPQKYVESAFSNSTYFKDMVNDGVEIGLYTWSDYLGSYAKENMVNYEMEESLPIGRKTLVKEMVKVSLYRCMPYCMKNLFQYDINSLNNDVVESKENLFRHFDDKWFGEKVAEGIRLTDVEKVFRFYHLGGPHLELDNPVRSAKTALEIVYDYLDKMQELGIYDDATIIITTDHGYSGGGDTLDLPQGTAVPLIMVKPYGSGGNEKVEVSNAPISQTDLFKTVLDGFTIEDKHFSQSVFDISADQNRERYYYYTALYSDEQGEVELRKYLVDGDARMAENYHYTGEKWPVKYSFNRISDINK